MPAWPGGECPECGDLMPPNLITCQTCRALLNTDLQVSFVDIPEFVPLREISAGTTICEQQSESSDSGVHTAVEPRSATAKGIFIQCPGCREELKVPVQYVNSSVLCNHCNHQFAPAEKGHQSRLLAYYADCPHCRKRMRKTVGEVKGGCLCEACGNGVKLEVPF